LSYVEGTVGHWINWSASDLDPASYSVTRNGTLVTSGTWDGSDIDVNVDALAVGTYIFAINVSDGSGNFATDSVTVTVTETPTTTSTGTTSTSTTGTTSGTTSSTTNGTTTTGASGIPQWAIIAAAAGAVVVVVIIIVMMKRK
ncbi:MAG: PKD domain-containing protein, partial [Candidatus Thorarchaeota archaeon]